MLSCFSPPEDSNKKNQKKKCNPFSVYKKVCKITKQNNNKKSTTTTVQLAYSTTMLFIIKHSMLLIKTLFTIVLPVGKPGHCSGESNRKHQGEKKKSRIRAKNTKQHFISDVRKQQHQYNVNIKRAAKKVKINSWSIANEFSSWVTIQKKSRTEQQDKRMWYSDHTWMTWVPVTPVGLIAALQ